MYVCMHVCMHACVYASMRVCMHVNMHECICACAYQKCVCYFTMSYKYNCLLRQYLGPKRLLDGHTHTHIHTYIHTHRLGRINSLKGSMPKKAQDFFENLLGIHLYYFFFFAREILLMLKVVEKRKKKKTRKP